MARKAAESNTWGAERVIFATLLRIDCFPTGAQPRLRDEHAKNVKQTSCQLVWMRKLLQLSQKAPLKTFAIGAVCSSFLTVLSKGFDARLWEPPVRSRCHLSNGSGISLSVHRIAQAGISNSDHGPMRLSSRTLEGSFEFRADGSQPRSEAPRAVGSIVGAVFVREALSIWTREGSRRCLPRTR